MANNNFLYNGEYQDPATQLVYPRARNYSPHTARFMSRDAYDVWNKYNFGNANPINNIDPSGHMSQVLSGMLLGFSLVTTVPSAFESVTMLTGIEAFSAKPFVAGLVNITNTTFTGVKVFDSNIHNQGLIITSYMLSGLGLLYGRY